MASVFRSGLSTLTGFNVSTGNVRIGSVQTVNNTTTEFLNNTVLIATSSLLISSLNPTNSTSAVKFEFAGANALFYRSTFNGVASQVIENSGGGALVIKATTSTILDTISAGTTILQSCSSGTILPTLRINNTASSNTTSLSFNTQSGSYSFFVTPNNSNIGGLVSTTLQIYSYFPGPSSVFTMYPNGNLNILGDFNNRNKNISTSGVHLSNGNSGFINMFMGGINSEYGELYTNGYIKIFRVGQPISDSNEMVVLSPESNTSCRINNGLILNTSSSIGSVSYGVLKIQNSANENAIFIRDSSTTNTTTPYNGWLVGNRQNTGGISTFSIMRCNNGDVGTVSSVFITSFGNVGIGQTNPYIKLQAVANINNGLDGIATRWGDVNTIIGNYTVANTIFDTAGSIQATRLNDTRDPWILALNPRGGTVVIGSTTHNTIIMSNQVGVGTNDINGQFDINGTLRVGNDGRSDNNLSTFLINLGRAGGPQGFRTGFIYGSGFDMTISNQQNGFFALATNNTNIITMNANKTVSFLSTCTAVDFIATSDMRLKDRISTIQNPLSTISQLRGVSYYHISTNTKKLGVIAQEIEKVLPEVVTTDDSPNKYKAVAYGNITAVLIEAIKELSNKVDYIMEKINN